MNVKPFVLPPDIQAAFQLQQELRSQVILSDVPAAITYLAGADLALSPYRAQAVAAVILYRYPSMEEVERVYATDVLVFPYVPGFLSFREGPVLTKAFAKLSRPPSAVMFDGHGIAHPRRLGIASHMGLHLNLPTLGCAKSLLCGKYEEPGQERGDQSPLIYKKEIVGTVLRTRSGVKPVFISPGYRISLEQAVEIALHCDSGRRLPTPTREADKYVGQLKKKIFEEGFKAEEVVSQEKKDQIPIF